MTMEMMNMTENKRFRLNLEDLSDNNKVFENDEFYCYEDNSDALIDRLNEFADENEQLKSDRVRFEEETRLEITRVMDKIFELIDKKIEFYKHKPVSAPISNPINPNFDRDVDRLARLTELEDLKETLKELKE